MKGEHNLYSGWFVIHEIWEITQLYWANDKWRQKMWHLDCWWAKMKISRYPINRWYTKHIEMHKSFKRICVACSINKWLVEIQTALVKDYKRRAGGQNTSLRMLHVQIQNSLSWGLLVSICAMAVLVTTIAVLWGLKHVHLWRLDKK